MYVWNMCIVLQIENLNNMVQAFSCLCVRVYLYIRVQYQSGITVFGVFKDSSIFHVCVTKHKARQR